MKRRTLIEGMAGGALAGLGANILHTDGRAGELQMKPGNIPMRVFGKTGVKLTVIGLASGRFHLTGSDEEAIALTRHAVALGVNYFDTAHTYWNGHSEEVYGRVLPEFRKQVFIATKSNRRDRKGAEEDLNTSLKSLKTEYLDLWQVHEIKTMEEVEKVFAPGGAIEAFEAAKKAGKAASSGSPAITTRKCIWKCCGATKTGTPF